MSMQVEIYKGSRIDDVFRKIQSECQDYKIIDQKETRHKLFFWKKEYEIKILVNKSGAGSKKEPAMSASAHYQQEPAAFQPKTPEAPSHPTFSGNTGPPTTKAPLDPQRKMILDLLEGKNLPKNGSVDPQSQKLGAVVNNLGTGEIEEIKQMLAKVLTKIDQDKTEEVPGKAAVDEKETENAEVPPKKNLFEEFLEKELGSTPKPTYKAGTNLLQIHYDRLIDMEVKQEKAENIIEGVKNRMVNDDLEKDEEVEKAVQKRIESFLNVTKGFNIENISTIALVGPTGVGKTTTLAKVAGILKKQGKRIGLISTDVYRIGAIDQLDTYAKILDSNMKAAESAEDLKEAIEYFKNVERVDYILIDTVGRSPMLAKSIESIKEYLDISQPDHTALVLSSTQKEKDMLQILENYSEIDINSIVFTKLDETTSFGFLLNVLAETDLPVSYITNGQVVPEDIYEADGAFLARKILTGGDENGSSVVSSQPDE